MIDSPELFLSAPSLRILRPGCFEYQSFKWGEGRDPFLGTVWTIPTDDQTYTSRYQRKKKKRFQVKGCQWISVLPWTLWYSSFKPQKYKWWYRTAWIFHPIRDGLDKEWMYKIEQLVMNFYVYICLISKVTISFVIWQHCINLTKSLRQCSSTLHILA